LSVDFDRHHPERHMATPQFAVLDTSDERQRALYERALFRAFSTPSVVLEQVWEFDRKSRRARTAVPYGSQEIYVAWLEGVVVAGVAVNFNTRDRLQLEMMGFSVDKNEPGLCEGLALFNHRLFADSSMVALGLRDFSLERLKARGVTRLYGTCTERKLRGYRVLGWEPIDSREFTRGRVYLIAQDMVYP
jgi:hypothetical protein